MLSTLVLTLFSTLPDEQFLSWGWRIPFLLSSLLLAVGLFVRLKVAESPLFTEVREQSTTVRRPLVEILRKPKPLLQACFIVFGATVTQALTSIFVINYASGIGYGRTEILISQLLNGISAVLAMPLAAALSDRFGRRPVLMGAALTLAVVAFPVFAMVRTGDTLLMFIALSVLAPLPMGALLGPIPALYSEMFGTRTRYTGVSMGYQLAAVIGGGFAPLIGASLLSAMRRSRSVTGLAVHAGRLPGQRHGRLAHGRDEGEGSGVHGIRRHRCRLPCGSELARGKGDLIRAAVTRHPGAVILHHGRASRTVPCGSSSLVEQPPCGEGERGPDQSGGRGELDVQAPTDLFDAAGDAAVVQVEEVGGPAQGAGGAVGVQGLQVVRAGGDAADRDHVGVVACGVLGYLGEQRHRPQCVVVDDELRRGVVKRRAVRAWRQERSGRSAAPM